MSDEKKFQRIMTDHVDRQIQQEWMRKYSPRAVHHFMRPARFCEICGTPMDVNPENGRNYQMDEWERKWSVHRYCAKQVENRLDRESNMLGRRQ
jgi:hypothetical protein